MRGLSERVQRGTTAQRDQEAETDEAKAEDGKRAMLGKTVQKSAGHSSLQVTTDRKSCNRRRIAGETLKRAIEEDIKREKP